MITGILFSYLMVGIGCQPSQEKSHPSSLDYLSSKLALRWQQGDTIPVVPDLLNAAFFDDLADFETVSSASQQFPHPRRSFVRVRRLYAQAQGPYLSVIVDDCAADSLLLHNLWQRWSGYTHTQEEGFGKSSPDIWRWQENPLTKATRLEAVWQTRYVLTIQTNHSDGKRWLLRAWKAINWEAFPS